MSELKLYEISEEYISYISTIEKKMFFPQRKMTGTIHGSIWALYTALTGITITSLFPHLKILITEWKMEYRKSGEPHYPLTTLSQETLPHLLSSPA